PPGARYSSVDPGSKSAEGGDYARYYPTCRSLDPKDQEDPQAPASPPWVFGPSSGSGAQDSLDYARWYPTVKSPDPKQQHETDMYQRLRVSLGGLALALGSRLDWARPVVEGLRAGTPGPEVLRRAGRAPARRLRARAV